MQGKVFIVGAGIGGVAYLTVRAEQVIKNAEIIISDALVDPEILNIAAPQAHCIIAGKRGGQESVKQATINQMLVQYCLEGKQVVRLKSGDPWIFGRSLPEILALQAAECAWELVSGISSAIAAPMLAGIPLTEMATSSCFAVMTGHDLERLPWEAIAEIPTLIILMGTQNLVAILAKLQISKGDNMPVAIVRWCGRRDQQVWTGTIANIQSQLPTESLSPAVIIIGEVVKFREQLTPTNLNFLNFNSLNFNSLNFLKSMPQETLPLQGKRILVTRAASQASQFRDLLIGQGADVIEMPTLAILPPSSWELLDRAIANLHSYHWLILTSANAVEHFFDRLHHAGKDSRSLFALKIAAVGRKTAEVLDRYGIIPDLVPTDFVADSLGDALLDNHFKEQRHQDSLNQDSINQDASCYILNGKKILFPRVQSGGREVLVEQLQENGAVVDAVPAYESGCPAHIDADALAAIQTQQIEAIAFASSKTVKHFCQLLNGVTSSEVWQEWLKDVKIASIGPQTSATCHELLGRVDVEAGEYTLDGLATAIAKLFAVI